MRTILSYASIRVKMVESSVGGNERNEDEEARAATENAWR